MLAAGEYWLAIREDGAKGTGSAIDPFDASGPCLFRDLMNNFDINTTIHLGPGIFQTFGFVVSLLELSWVPKSGQRIIGAGIHATTLKVVGATQPEQLTFAIGNDINIAGHALEGFEASDFTVDCNMRGHQGVLVAIAAVGASGNRIRLRRIRAIDFGTQHFNSTDDPGIGRVECFVIFTAGARFTNLAGYDCVVEDCILERPSPNDSFTTTGILFNSGENDQSQMGYTRSCVMRNCYIDYEFKNSPVAITGIASSGLTATATTKTPHGRRKGDWVVVTGALIPSVDNPFNGSYKIEAVLGNHQSNTNWPSSPLRPRQHPPDRCGSANGRAIISESSGRPRITIRSTRGPNLE